MSTLTTAVGGRRTFLGWGLAGTGRGPTVRQASELRSARIESMRALAAVAVLVGHAYGWAHHYRPEIYGSFIGRALLGGGFGVYLFFALSGYLLFLPFARAAWGPGGRIDLATYARNRALRVLPLYLVVMAVYLATVGDGLRHDWWRFALLIQGFWPDTVARVDGPAWSLAVEVQFYALLPLVAWLLARGSKRSLRRAVLLVAAAGVALLALRIATVTTSSASAVWTYSLGATAVFFVPGLLLALLRVHTDAGRPRWATLRFSGSSGLWLAAAAGLAAVCVWRYDLDAVLLPACFLAVGAVALPLRPTRALSLLDWRPLGMLGVASYSLYLWHEPIVHALAGTRAGSAGFPGVLAASLLACVPLAAVSYLAVERPFLGLRRRWEPPTSGHGTSATIGAENPSRGDAVTTAEGFELRGPSTPVPLLLRELWRSRALLVILARKDFLVRYRRTVFGVLWAVGLPIAQAAVLAIVFSRVVSTSRLVGGHEVPYAVFVYAALVPWSYLAATVPTAATAIVDNAGLASKVYFPRAVSVGVVVLTSTFPVFVGAIALLLLAVVTGTLGVEFLWVVPGTLLALAVATSLGLALSALHVYFRDVRYVVAAFLTVGFYVTPVIYSLDALPPLLRRIVELLPATGPSELFRAAVGAADAGWVHAVIASLFWCIVVGAAGLVLQSRRDRVFVDLL